MHLQPAHRCETHRSRPQASSKEGALTPPRSQEKQLDQACRVPGPLGTSPMCTIQTTDTQHMLHTENWKGAARGTSCNPVTQEARKVQLVVYYKNPATRTSCACLLTAKNRVSQAREHMFQKAKLSLCRRARGNPSACSSPSTACMNASGPHMYAVHAARFGTCSAAATSATMCRGLSTARSMP